ncbi:hypothetical protein DFR64_1005 [Pelolinea submarina]|uniref:Uncharacterized protein n=1 Tax=Pelolinea submarina TaxID=913107 RepID=A0A3E0AMK0_9CHLR|nr:hypothetical protein DFR64_1005 [Pelolinea submarina]
MMFTLKKTVEEKKKSNSKIILIFSSLENYYFA